MITTLILVCLFPFAIFASGFVIGFMAGKAERNL